MAEMEVDEEAAPLSREPFALPILQLVKSEQKLNGVSHSDYERYR